MEKDRCEELVKRFADNFLFCFYLFKSFGGSLTVGCDFVIDVCVIDKCWCCFFWGLSDQKAEEKVEMFTAL